MVECMMLSGEPHMQKSAVIAFQNSRTASGFVCVLAQSFVALNTAKHKLKFSLTLCGEGPARIHPYRL